MSKKNTVASDRRNQPDRRTLRSFSDDVEQALLNDAHHKARLLRLSAKIVEFTSDEIKPHLPPDRASQEEVLFNLHYCMRSIEKDLAIMTAAAAKITVALGISDLDLSMAALGIKRLPH